MKSRSKASLIFEWRVDRKKKTDEEEMNVDLEDRRRRMSQ